MRNGPGAGSKELLAGGAEGNRTPDLCSAIAALSHLSYSPAPPAGRRNLEVPACGSGSPSGLFPPLQRLSRESFGPPISLLFVSSNRNGSRRPFVSFARLMAGSAPAFQLSKGVNMAYDRYDRDERTRWSDERDRNWRGERSHDPRGGRDERGFWDRASDEVASWFGDEDAERRRRRDRATTSAWAILLVTATSAARSAEAGPLRIATKQTAASMAATRRLMAEAGPTATSTTTGEFSIVAGRASAITTATGAATFGTAEAGIA